MTKICVSIAEETYEGLISVLNNINFAEIRLDISRISNDEIKLVFKSGKRLVATCREGFYSDDERKERLKIAIENGASYVDIETEANDVFREELIAHAKKYGVKIIISYHNFSNTPSSDELEQIVSTCKNQGADVTKLVTTSESEKDSSRVLALYSNHNNLLAFAMGKPGRITRISSIYLGAEFTYAAQSEGKAVAGGQLSKEQMEIIEAII